MKAHPKHPRCPSCGMAMYKSSIKGKQVKASDHWAFCRSQKCALVARNQAANGHDFSPKPKLKAKARARTQVSPQASAESDSVAKARARVRELVSKAVPEGTAKATVGIVLALVSQETGNHRAANALIDEYGLADALGISKVEDGALDEKRS